MTVNKLLAPFRAACRTAFDSLKPFAAPFELGLPGDAWEPFVMCEGGPVWWRSMPCSFGVMVEFRATAPARMAMHFHEDSPEVLFVAAGRLTMHRDAQTFEMGPGETWHAQSGRPHAASFDQPGHVIAWWPTHKPGAMMIGVI